jgi:branched-chain amino acid transport system substrate-binding protein
MHRLARRENHMTGNIFESRTSGMDRRRNLQGIAGGIAATGAMSLFGPAVRAAKPIKIGYVSPRSGPLAAFAEADDFVLGEFRKFVKDGLKVGSQVYPIEVVTKDSQSNPNRAAEVAKELITRDNVSIILVGATPETNNPVATQCELEQIPCISSVAPWQTNFIGRQANPADSKSWKPFDYTFHYFWASKTSSASSAACGSRSQPTNRWARCFPTTPTATPGATRPSVFRRCWPRKVSS